MLRFFKILRRYRLIANVKPVIVVIDLCAHAHKVDNAAEICFTADRKLQRDGVCSQTLAHHVHDVKEISTDDVHFVDIGNAGNMVAFRLMPNSLALGLNAALCTEYRNRTVKHAQGAFDLNSEINMPRCVNDVYAAIVPIGGCCGGGDGDAAFALLFHVVHGGCALVNFARAVNFARIEQNALGRCCFARVNMSHDADVARHLKGCFARHCRILLSALLKISEISLCSFWIFKRNPKNDSGFDVSENGKSEPEVCESLVRFCHLVNVLFLFESGALLIAGIKNFAGEPFLHGALAPCACIKHDPAQTESLAAFRTDFEGNLIGGTADTASLDFQNGHDVVHCFLEYFKRLTAGLFTNDIESTVAGLLSRAAFAVEHNLVDELGYELAAVNRIIKNFPLGNKTSPGHSLPPYFLGRFAP